jgi:hypothetical protein
MPEQKEAYLPCNRKAVFVKQDRSPNKSKIHDQKR